MNIPKDFAREVQRIKQNFSDFLVKEKIQEKAAFSIADLEEKEQKLLAATLNTPIVDLPSHFEDALKKHSLSLYAHKQTYEVELQKVFSAGYTTNYDLELKDFSKGTYNTISFDVKDITRARDGHIPKTA
jgi:hypothetical protein